MFNWLKEWLSSTPYNSTTTFKCDVPMPKVKRCTVPEESPYDREERLRAEKSEKSISEPVLSFVKTVQNNHKRFKVEISTLVDSISTMTYVHAIYDKHTNKTFQLHEKLYTYSLINQFKGVGEVDFLTSDEAYFAFSRIRDVYQTRKKKLDSIKNQRKRKALTKLYGEQQ